MLHQVHFNFPSPFLGRRQINLKSPLPQPHPLIRIRNFQNRSRRSPNRHNGIIGIILQLRNFLLRHKQMTRLGFGHLGRFGFFRCRPRRCIRIRSILLHHPMHHINIPIQLRQFRFTIGNLPHQRRIRRGGWTRYTPHRRRRHTTRSTRTSSSSHNILFSSNTRWWRHHPRHLILIPFFNQSNPLQYIGHIVQSSFLNS